MAEANTKACKTLLFQFAKVKQLTEDIQLIVDAVKDSKVSLLGCHIFKLKFDGGLCLVCVRCAL